MEPLCLWKKLISKYSFTLRSNIHAGQVGHFDAYRLGRKCTRGHSAFNTQNFHGMECASASINGFSSLRNNDMNSSKQKHRKTKSPKPGSTPWHPTVHRLNAKPIWRDYTLKETKHQGIFGSSLLEDYDISIYGQKANEIFSLKTEYVAPVNFSYALPTSQVPEIAFVGRSNVGKSSLINTLLTEKKLVRISKEPGCTKTINFFGFINAQFDKLDGSKQSIEMGQHMLYLVDLPGYGFAKVSKEERERWQEVMDGYLMTRDFLNLRRVFVLIDARHGVKESDQNMMLRLDEAEMPYQVILTKVDVATKEELQTSLISVFDQVMAQRQSAALPFVHVVSSVTGSGISSLKLNIAQICSETVNSVEHEAVDTFEEEVIESHGDMEIDVNKMAALEALKANMEEEEEFTRIHGSFRQLK